MWRLEAIESRSLAAQMLDSIVDSSIQNLANRHVIEFSEKRSVAADTRQLEKDRMKFDLTMAGNLKFFQNQYAI